MWNWTLCPKTPLFSSKKWTFCTYVTFGQLHKTSAIGLAYGELGVIYSASLTLGGNIPSLLTSFGDMLSKRNIREEPQRITLLRRLSSKILLKLRPRRRRKEVYYLSCNENKRLIFSKGRSVGSATTKLSVNLRPPRSLGLALGN